MSAYESSGSRSKKHRRPLFKSYSLNPFPEKSMFYSSSSSPRSDHHYTSLSSPRIRVTSKNKSMICSCIHSEKVRPAESMRRVRGERLDKIASYHHLPRIRISRSSSREDVETTRRHSVVQETMTQFRASSYHHRPLSRSSSAHIVNGRLFKYFQESIQNDDGLGKEDERARSSSSSDEEGDFEGGKRHSPDPGLGSSETDSLEMELAVLNFGEEESGSEDTISLKCIKESLLYHKYAASRGQREKELEICEVVPTQISRC